jgi:pyruvate/2-oxoglutarate dehydrogenase complex dihydrolipoamide acyltransferase (E2) component
MKAKAKNPHRTIRAFTGLEYVAYEWRPVPAGNDDEVARLAGWGYLELEDDAPPAAAAVNATESAVKLAAEEGVDLADVVGSGVGGRITYRDVQAAWTEEEE